MAYDNQCGSCEYFKDMRSNDDRYFDIRYYELGHCVWYRSCYYPDDSCSHYKKQGSSSSLCYLTTIICNRLGYADSDENLEVMRDFRNKYLQKNQEYDSLLYEYDVVGPKISEHLMTEDLSIIQKLFLSFIKPITLLIKQGNYQNAIERYQQMTLSLKDYYGITDTLDICSDYDFSKGGHGYIKKKSSF